MLFRPSYTRRVMPTRKPAFGNSFHIWKYAKTEDYSLLGCDAVLSGRCLPIWMGKCRLELVRKYMASHCRTENSSNESSPHSRRHLWMSSCNVRIVIFWDVTLYSLGDRSRRLKGASTILKMAEARYFKISASAKLQNVKSWKTIVKRTSNSTLKYFYWRT